ncbi:MAG: RNA polymerase sigma factor [Acidobacteriota bacterium]|nr:MAG: RNA polymerase sigma factor [Acidobacteriota bacterium]
MQTSDAELVTRAMEGDREAFRAITERYQRLVFSIAYHYMGSGNDVEDIAQDVFLRFFQSIHRYDTSRPLKNWLGKITANRCLDELRRQRSNPVHSMAELDTEEGVDINELFAKHASTGSMSEEESERCFQLLHTAMLGLSDKDRMAFVLREMEDLEYSQIAEILGTSEVAVRIRLSRTRQKLEGELRRMFDEQL